MIIIFKRRKTQLHTEYMSFHVFRMNSVIELLNICEHIGSKFNINLMKVMGSSEYEGESVTRECFVGEETEEKSGCLMKTDKTRKNTTKENEL